MTIYTMTDFDAKNEILTLNNGDRCTSMGDGRWKGDQGVYWEKMVANGEGDFDLVGYVDNEADAIEIYTLHKVCGEDNVGKFFTAEEITDWLEDAIIDCIHVNDHFEKYTSNPAEYVKDCSLLVNQPVPDSILGKVEKAVTSWVRKTKVKINGEWEYLEVK